MKIVFAPKINHKFLYLFARTVAITITLIVFIVFFLEKRTPLKFYKHYREDDVDCHFREKDNLLLANDYDFTSRKQIFFLETSCKGGLDSRQACAVESAARANPRWNINVFFVGPPSYLFLNSTVYKFLSQMNNVNFYRVIISTFHHNTPMRAFLRSDIMYTNKKYSLKNLADMLRYLTLYKYGGVYLDLDMISVKGLDAFPPNWVAKRTNGALGAGAMGFARDSVGRRITEKIIQDFTKSYNPYLWSQLSTGVLTRVLREICTTGSVAKMSNETCPGLSVLDRLHFYPIHYSHAVSYFAVRDSHLPVSAHIYAHHLWDNRTRGIGAPSGSMLAKIAQQACPITHRLYGNKFGF